MDADLLCAMKYAVCARSLLATVRERGEGGLKFKLVIRIYLLSTRI